MKRKFSLGFILLFLLYLGCKSSIFGVCLSNESVVEKSTVPPCHQTQAGESETKEGCDCPIVLESLQFSTDTTNTDGKPLVTTVDWLGTKPWVLSSAKQIGNQLPLNFSHEKLPPFFPTRTIRLLI
ncbi:hypothetical protein AB3N60_18070 [Leptospira sp. WS39.C2]